MKKYEKPELEEIVFTSEMVALDIESAVTDEDFE